MSSNTLTNKPQTSINFHSPPSSGLLLSRVPVAVAEGQGAADIAAKVARAIDVLAAQGNASQLYLALQMLTRQPRTVALNDSFASIFCR